MISDAEVAALAASLSDAKVIRAKALKADEIEDGTVKDDEATTTGLESTSESEVSRAVEDVDDEDSGRKRDEL